MGGVFHVKYEMKKINILTISEKIVNIFSWLLPFELVRFYNQTISNIEYSIVNEINYDATSNIYKRFWLKQRDSNLLVLKSNSDFPLPVKRYSFYQKKAYVLLFSRSSLYLSIPYMFISILCIPVILLINNLSLFIFMLFWYGSCWFILCFLQKKSRLKDISLFNHDNLYN